MIDPLDACRKKVARAEHHLRAYEQAVKEWGGPYPYAIDKEFDTDVGEYVLRLRKLRDAPVIEWGIILGDAVHNLRSALDHVICAIIRNRDASASCWGTGFPILVDEKMWDLRRKKELHPSSGLARLRGIDDWTLEFVKRCQPFTADQQTTGRDHPLLMLNELSNIDKHRALHVTEVFHYSPEIEFTAVGSGEVTWVHPGGPLDPGSELLRYRITRGKGHARIESNTQLGADIVFGHDSGRAEGMYVSKLLRWLHAHVEWIVDTVGYKHFGGREPAGLRRITSTATAAVSVAESPELG